MIELLDFQQQASDQIADRVLEYAAAPVRVGKGDKQRQIPFVQLLNSITASGKTLILAEPNGERDFTPCESLADALDICLEADV